MHRELRHCIQRHQVCDRLLFVAKIDVTKVQCFLKNLLAVCFECGADRCAGDDTRMFVSDYVIWDVVEADHCVGSTDTSIAFDRVQIGASDAVLVSDQLDAKAAEL